MIFFKHSLMTWALTERLIEVWMDLEMVTFFKALLLFVLAFITVKYQKITMQNCRK